MKKVLLFICSIIVISTTEIYAQGFGVISDTIRINPARDTLDQTEIDSMLFYDSVYGNVTIVNLKKDDECGDCNGKYCMVRKIKNGNIDLDFCNSGFPYVPVFQEYFYSGIDPLIWNSAKSQEYSHNWGTLYTKTYPNGFGYYDHQMCDYFKINPKQNTTIGGITYNNVDLMSIYNSNFPSGIFGSLSYAQKNEKVANNNTIQQWYVKENTVVEDGVLKLYTKYEPNLGSKTWFIGGELPAIDENNTGVLLAPSSNLTKNQIFTSSYFESTKYFEYGMFQAKITVPNKDGLWPAFWLVGGIKSAKNWSCNNEELYYEELDIFEFMGNNDDKMLTTIHAPSKIKQQWQSSYTKSNFFLHPHIYTCYWTDCGIWIFIDEGAERKKVLEYHHYPGVVGGDCKIKADKNYYKNLRYPTQPMKIVFNTAVYSCQNLKPEITGFPVSMDVEWVKVFYQRPCIEVKEVSNSDEVNNINQELFNVWTAKLVKMTGSETFVFQSDNVYEPTRIPLLKVIVEDGFEIEPSVSFESGNMANLFVEFSDNICQNYGSIPPPLNPDSIQNAQFNSDKIQTKIDNEVISPKFNNDKNVKIARNSNIISVYPNPASTYLTLELGLNSSSLLTRVEFLKLDGTKIGEFLVKTNNSSFYIGNLPDGIYLLRAYNADFGTSTKLITVIK